VADYWKDYFEKRGLKNIKVIYNYFDIQHYNVSENEVTNFKKKYNLTNKPIIYLGNSQYEKGTEDAYLSLKDFDYYLVTSGIPKLNLPVLNLKLKFTEYLLLLKAASVTVLMSKFPEGWNRIAHESILMGTPVIGSGMGGMSELLKKSNQTICTNLTELPKLIEQLVKTPTYMKNAVKYAREFTLESFEQDWLSIEF
jgi:glycosyltransferase involved in cell wall biosynthesis